MHKTKSSSSKVHGMTFLLYLPVYFSFQCRISYGGYFYFLNEIELDFEIAFILAYIQIYNSEGRFFYFHKNDYFSLVHHLEWCFSCGRVRCCLVFPQDMWQLFYIGSFSLFYFFPQSSQNNPICCLNLSVCLRMLYKSEPLLDVQP